MNYLLSLLHTNDCKYYYSDINGSALIKLSMGTENKLI